MVRLGMFLMLAAVVLFFVFATRQGWIVFADYPSLEKTCERACMPLHAGRLTVQTNRTGEVQTYSCECR